jgi:predicted transcriptional regulator
MPPTRSTLAVKELALLKIVWRSGAVTVRDVYEILRRRRPVAYTTVMTMMNILEEKGYLKKTAEGRAFRYRAARPETRVIATMVREFVDRVFDGSAQPLLAHLARDTRLSKAEREELRRLIEDVE